MVADGGCGDYPRRPCGRKHSWANEEQPLGTIMCVWTVVQESINCCFFFVNAKCMCLSSRNVIIEKFLFLRGKSTLPICHEQDQITHKTGSITQIYMSRTRTLNIVIQSFFKAKINFYYHFTVYILLQYP